jgi:hypothetical protein
MFMNPLLIWREVIGANPNQLTHINSDLCWFDPIVEVNERGLEV